MIQIISFLACLLVFSNAHKKNSHAYDPPDEWQPHSRSCDAFLTADTILRGTCQFELACGSFISLTPYVNPAEGPVCSMWTKYYLCYFFNVFIAEEEVCCIQKECDLTKWKQQKTPLTQHISNQRQRYWCKSIRAAEQDLKDPDSFEPPPYWSPSTPDIQPPFLIPYVYWHHRHFHHELNF